MLGPLSNPNVYAVVSTIISQQEGCDLECTSLLICYEQQYFKKVAKYILYMLHKYQDVTKHILINFDFYV